MTNRWAKNRIGMAGTALLLAFYPALAWAAETACINDAPNPYHLEGSFGKLPKGRVWAAINAVRVAPDGTIWAADRCGDPNCAGSAVNPIFQMNASGKVLKNFGAGLFVFPHSILVDNEGNIWVADNRDKDGANGEKMGQQVTKLSPQGKVLMRLGTAGKIGAGSDTFDQPNAVAIAPNGDIFVAEGHTPTNGNSRIMKFSKDGAFIKSFGSRGVGPTEFLSPHDIAFDADGRLFVGDRGNNRVSIYDQDGKLIDIWVHVGRPSGIAIVNGMLYVADADSDPDPKSATYNPHHCNRGIRVVEIKTGKVVALIPPPDPTGKIAPPEGVAVANDGTIYAAQVFGKDVKTYVKN